MTGLVALPFLVLFILKGSPTLFSSLSLLLTFMGLTEFYRMALPHRKLEGILAALAGTALPIAIVTHSSVWFLLTLTSLVIITSLLFLFRITDIKQAANESALIMMGYLYVPLLLGHLMLLRNLPHGISWVFLMMVVVMSGDTAAFYVGSSIGKNKLYPIVSPNKSVEGSIGGLFGSVLGAIIAHFTFFPELAISSCIITALLLGTLGQLGDLFESLVKRSCGVKDSGTIFPGHGGVLDRLDSILFAAPAAYYYALFFFR